MKKFAGLYLMVLGCVCFIEITLGFKPNVITLVAVFFGSLLGEFYILIFKPYQHAKAIKKAKKEREADEIFTESPTYFTHVGNKNIKQVKNP